MYRWHFDTSKTEAIVYADNEMEARKKINVLFPIPDGVFELIGVEEILSIEDKLA